MSIYEEKIKKNQENFKKFLRNFYEKKRGILKFLGFFINL